MTTLIDAPPVPPLTGHSAAVQLRTKMAALRLCFTWFGVRRSLTPEQKSQAADTFAADSQFVSAGKKLIDTSHAAYRAVNAIRSQCVRDWRAMTLPYPEPGIRLIRRDEIQLFEDRAASMRQALAQAVSNLEAHYAEIQAAARRRLGRLYNPADYPGTLSGLFDVAWDYPNVEPPSYLRQLSPALYEQESRRVAARFDEAVALAEQAFVDEFAKVVSHLTERLSGTGDGKEKVFRDSAVENLTEFFGRFKHLSVRSDQQLDELVDQAQRIVRGVRPQALRDDAPLRQQIATQLSAVQSQIDGMLIDRPRRKILRTR